MRRTKIVATLGPATDSPEVLLGILAAGVDVVRLNGAHSDVAGLAARLEAVRAAAKELGREVGVLVDLPGPKIRVGEVSHGTVLEPGAAFHLLADDCTGDSSAACVTHDELWRDVHAGDRVLIDDGRIELVVASMSEGDVETRVVTGGPLLPHKGVNVPGVTLSVSPITPLDREVAAWASDADVDWLGQSFVRSAQDVEHLRASLTRPVPIVAKIEKHEAAAAIDDILSAADAVMVARGDLGVETSPEEVQVLQRRIVTAARAAGKPVVIATEMLDSMRTNPRPTRAEASDVAAAIFQRADAVMLSGETAVGAYPVVAVETMARIATTAEAAAPPAREPHGQGTGNDVQVAMSAAVADLAVDLDLAAIVTLTQSGATALAVARFRPSVPIVAATPSAHTARRLALVWGVRAAVFPFEKTTPKLLDTVESEVRSRQIAAAGERIAITAGLASRTPGGTDFVHVRVV